MLRLEANLLVIGNALKPAQIYAINEKLRLVSEEQNLKEKMVARDRIDLILKIFEKHAEVKLDFRLSLLRLSIWDLESMEWVWSSVGKEVLLEVEAEQREESEKPIQKE